MKRYAIILCALTLGVSACGEDALPVRDELESIEQPCLVTAMGAKLCGADAVAWCTAIEDFDGKIPTAARDACVSVGYVVH